MASHTTNEEVKQLRGWSDLQYQRFHTVVIEEGRKIVYEDKYWQENKKPENLLWSNLSVSVVKKLVENVRNELQEDDMETKMQIDTSIVKWKLQPWLRKKHNQRARQPGSAASSAGDRQKPNATPVAVGVETCQAADHPIAHPGSPSPQYYDPITDAAKETPGPS